MKLDGDKQTLEETHEEESKQAKQKLQRKYNKRDELNAKIKPLKEEITNMNNVRNCLHESISDLEKVMKDLNVRYQRQNTKQ